MGEVGNYRVHNHSKANSSSHTNFSSGPSSSSRFMPSIPENVNEMRNPENGQLGDGDVRDFEAVFPQDSWNDPPFNSLKRNRDGDAKMFSNFSGLDNQVRFSPSSFCCSVYCVGFFTNVIFLIRMEKQEEILRA